MLHSLQITFVLMLISITTFTQTCTATFTNEGILNANSIYAPFYANGYFFHDDSDGSFFPDYVAGTENPTSFFAAGLWLGATDPRGNLLTAASTYGGISERYDYWGGPMLPSLGVAWGNGDDCGFFDKVWKVKGYEIAHLLDDFEDNGQIDNTLPESIKSWPSRGNVFFEEANGFVLPTLDLAPFFDRNSNGIYEPMNGEHPIIGNDLATVIPDELLWAVFNDAANIHRESRGDPLRAEIQLTAWAFNCTDYDLLNQTIFTRQHITNFSDEAYHDMHIAIWTDHDIGCYIDDYFGCNPDLNTTYFYNYDELDGDETGACRNEVISFPDTPPVQAYTFLNHPMTSLSYYFNAGLYDGPPAQTDPNSPVEYYNYMRGFWRDGTPMEARGSGFVGTPFGSVADTTKFAFFDNPNNPTGWSQHAINFDPYLDTRTIGSTSVGIVEPRTSVHLDIAYSVHKKQGLSVLENVNLMEEQIPIIQAFYDSGFANACTQQLRCENDCVWPGDTNSDGIVNYRDVLPIGIGEGKQARGTKRSTKNASWRPYAVQNWQQNLLDGTNYKHLDSNGDGAILSNDVGVIEDNYNKTNKEQIAPLQAPEEDGKIKLRLRSGRDTIQFIGSPLRRSISLKLELDTESNGLYGIAFRIEYDFKGTEGNGGFSPRIATNHFLNENSNHKCISLTKEQSVEQKIDLAISRINLEDATGSDQIATIVLLVSDENTTAREDGIRMLNLYVTDVVAINAKEEVLSVASDTLSIPMINTPYDSLLSSSTSIIFEEDVELSLYPNPTDDNFTIQTDMKVCQITLFDVQGQIRASFPYIDDTIQLPPSLPSGVYFVQFLNEQGRHVTKRLVLK